MHLHDMQIQSLARQRRDDLLREAARERLVATFKSTHQPTETAQPSKHRDGVTIWRPRLVHQAA